MKLPRISLADVLWAIALLPISLWMLASWVEYHYEVPLADWFLILMLPCLGAGFGALGGNKRAGLLWGLVAVAAIVLFCVLFPQIQSARE